MPSSVFLSSAFLEHSNPEFEWPTGPLLQDFTQAPEHHSSIKFIRNMPHGVTSPQFDREFSKITSRIRYLMFLVVPESWSTAELVVREADPHSDEFIEIDTPLLNPATGEIIGALPKDLLDAIEELYLLFPAYYCPWETCVISMELLPSSDKRHLRTRFYYSS